MKLAFVLLLRLQEPSEVQEQVGRLSSDSIEIRERAAEALVRIGSRALAAVLPLRDSTTPETARLARSIVGHSEWDPYLVPHLGSLPSVVFEDLGSSKLEDFERGVGALAPKAAEFLGFQRKVQEEKDDARLRVFFLKAPQAFRTRAHGPILKAWIRDLAPDEFWRHPPRTFGYEIFRVVLDREDFPPAYWKPLLRSPSPSQRWLAARVLGRLGDADGLEAILEFLDDRSPDVAQDAINLVTWGKYEKAREKLARMLAEGKGRTDQVLNSLSALGWKGDLEVIPAEARGQGRLQGQLHHAWLLREDRSRLPALLDKIRGMKQREFMGDEGWLEAALLYDTEEASQGVAEFLDRQDRIWGRHGDPYFEVSFGPRGACFLWERYRKEIEAGKKDSRTGGYLESFVEPRHLLEEARKTLRDRSDSKLAVMAVEIVEDASPPGALPDEDAVLVRGIARDRKLPAWGNAVRLLSGRSDPELPAILRELFRKEAGLEVFYFLAQVPGEDLRPVFLEHTKPAHPQPVRCAAVNALARLPSEETTRTLIKLLEDDDREVRNRALEGMGAPDLPQVAEALGKALEGDRFDAYWRREALRRLSAIRPVEARQYARTLLKSGPPPDYVVGAALDVLRAAPEADDREIARPWLEAPDSYQREQAMEVLVRLKDRECIELLTKMASREGVKERGAAYRLFALLGDPRGAAFLARAAQIETYENQRIALEELGRLGGDEARDCLGWCLGEVEAGRKAPAGWEILAGVLRDRRAIPSLLRLLEEDRKRAVPEDLEGGGAREALWALDVIVHREAYARIAAVPARPGKDGSLAEALASIGEAYGVRCDVSARLKRAREDRGSVSEQLSLAISGRLEDVLLRYAPMRLVYPIGGRRRFSVGYSLPLAWAHVLGEGGLEFMTPAEARDRWLAAPRVTK